MTTQDLDFTGGPWKLRNGDKVKNISFNSGIKKYISDNWIKDFLEWDEFGNCTNNQRSDLDIVENLDNWKYNRKDYTD